MKTAGFPPQISFSGTLLVTTEPAPIILFLPIVTPFNIMLEAPINAPSSIIIGLDLISESSLIFFCHN